MKPPRDVPADHLIRVLEGLGYETIRQKGSHIRLRRPGPPVHLITIPKHDALKTGTLRGILAEVALMRATTVEALAALL